MDSKRKDLSSLRVPCRLPHPKLSLILSRYRKEILPDFLHPNLKPRDSCTTPTLVGRDFIQPPYYPRGRCSEILDRTPSLISQCFLSDILCCTEYTWTDFFPRPPAPAAPSQANDRLSLIMQFSLPKARTNYHTQPFSTKTGGGGLWLEG
ncbi:hypothetical protein P175DRAFT_0298521 [Aspergillus ochraceoroseus IBT 24754]|uniref:Uncharacterized protein n=1 Tax=Aspergillus ochraceoroseus IBT 24754 TaxID=1392256 RepID=A0A2T5LSS8_9EURO|nr:uncharacterized protein P175DRAFT_0298521 [Aspergillus ochraceoroseus IBT 24754]PTU19334.1 hypothetical protein P175DRAFT_0298521 [Aspergillus ochraceoroseus IBT 24754]